MQADVKGREKLDLWIQINANFGVSLENVGNQGFQKEVSPNSFKI